jgi:hypothetical protein
MLDIYCLQKTNMYGSITKCGVQFRKSFQTPVHINPLPVQFKSLLPGQEGCIFFSGHLNVRKYHYAIVRFGRQAAFKSTTL